MTGVQTCALPISAGDNREELIHQYPISLEKAFEMGYNWTGRDHIISYDTRRAV